MAFDAGMMSFVINEINTKSINGKVEKIYQPSRDEFIFLIRAGGETHKLILNAGSSCPRISLTEIKPENPVKAPMMCMLFRKHLQGSVFLGAEQIGFDRICKMSFDTYDEMGFKCKKYIYFELMGTYSNIVFVDDNDKIINSLRIVEFSDTNDRAVLPGLKYELPPSQNKINPLNITLTEFNDILSLTSDDKRSDKFLLNSFSGISPLVSRELTYKICGNVSANIDEVKKSLPELFCNFINEIKSHTGTPCVVLDSNGKLIEYSFIDIDQYGQEYELTKFESFSQMLDFWFEEKSLGERRRQKAKDIMHIISSSESRIIKKLGLQQQDLDNCVKDSEYKLYGDLITANIYQIKKGTEKINVYDYINDKYIDININPKFTPAQNAQKYYKMYSKLKSAREHLTIQIEDSKRELDYIYSVADSLERATTEKELSEIRSELFHSGYASKLKNYNEKKQPSPSYLTFITSGGYTVLCGKNNVANDWLTFKHSNKYDWWFHAKDMPGSHVILECDQGDEPSTEDFTEACMIAAVYSKASTNTVADIDYTRVKTVKKPPNSKPGYVIYHSNWSATVKVDKKKVESLLKKQ